LTDAIHQTTSDYTNCKLSGVVEMVKRARSHVPSPAIMDTQTPSGLKPKYLSKQEFGRRVYQAIMKKGWSQSDAAREASKRGEPAVTRDDISRYVRGISLPTEGKLKKLAHVLDMTPEELLPNFVASAIDDDHPAFEMKVSPSNPGIAWLRVNRLVFTKTAVAVATLLENDNAADRAASG
jgi:transcriptional regulator with XRE-family HTH domain